MLAKCVLKVSCNTPSTGMSWSTLLRKGLRSHFERHFISKDVDKCILIVLKIFSISVLSKSFKSGSITAVLKIPGGTEHDNDQMTLEV